MTTQDKNLQMLPPLKMHMEKLAYALMSFALLWAGAGNIEVFWTRHWSFVFFGAAVCISIFRLEDWKISDYFESPWDKSSLLLSLLIAALCIGIEHFLPGTPMAKEELHTAHWLGMISFALLCIPIWEILSRGILAPRWGFGSVAFLDAVTWGVACQSIRVFIFAFLSCFLCGKIYEKKGPINGISSRILVSLIFFIYCFVL